MSKIHTFEKRVRSVSNLMAHPTDNSLFLCASVDGSFSIYCLDKFSCQYTFKFDTLDLLDCKFVSHERFFLMY